MGTLTWKYIYGCIIFLSIMSNKYSPRQAPSGRGEVYSRPSATIRRCKIRPRACPFKGILNTGSVDHLPFKGFPTGKPYRLLLGLREPQDPWLDVDEDDELLIDQLQQRAAHMRDRREAVIQLVDEVRIPIDEVRVPKERSSCSPTFKVRSSKPGMITLQARNI